MEQHLFFSLLFVLHVISSLCKTEIVLHSVGHTSQKKRMSNACKAVQGVLQLNYKLQGYA